MKSTILIFTILFSSLNAYTINGKVIDSHTGAALESVNIVWGVVGAATDENGRFTIKGDPEEQIVFSRIGYQTQTLRAIAPKITVKLKPVILRSAPVNVEANRAINGVSPVSFSTVTQEKIKMHYSVQDVPMILSSEPGTYAYSESGNGTGYSYVSIRGFDQSRISVMLDNVPLNDNESFQVYWVDHGDILSQAKDVQIQRGLGIGSTGFSEFGGSINLRTNVQSPKEKGSFSFGSGSYATTKVRAAYNSGKRFGEENAFAARVSQVESAGYRKYHNSFQRTGFLGFDHSGTRWTHKFRLILGKENTQLSWDGVPSSDINNRVLRREGYKAYTDNFLQKIGSINSTFKITPNLWFRNTVYLVTGAGYYRVRKYGENLVEYNLDYFRINPADTTTDLTRRKWIVNHYYGISPNLTRTWPHFRLDTGVEYRSYFGNHYGEVSDFSDDTLISHFGEKWYSYYQYTGKKSILNGFARIGVEPLSDLWIFVDGQIQSIQWNLDQDKIGHAVGYQLQTKWLFFNPRVGVSYRLSDKLRIFGSAGTGHKEPADDQIITADDIFGQPNDRVAPEAISSVEVGGAADLGRMSGKISAYIIEFKNEQLKQIDINQEGEYNYYTAPATRHEGIEAEGSWLIFHWLLISGNATIAHFHYTDGALSGNRIENNPEILLNSSLVLRLFRGLEIESEDKYIGSQTIDNQGKGKIPSYIIDNLYIRYHRSPMTFSLTINNLFDILYSTYGYDYEWNGLQKVYWPGATRNGFLEFTLNL